MQIINEILNNYKFIFKVGSFVYLFRQILNQNNNRKKLLQQLNQIQNSQIISLKQAYQQSKNNNNNQNDKKYLIKIIPQTNQSKTNKIFYTHTKALYSNQYWLVQPSLELITKQIIERISKAYKDQQQSKKTKELDVNNNILNQLQWMTSFDTSKYIVKKQTKHIKVKGLGTIVNDNIFNVQYKYTINQKRGVISSIYQNVSYFLEKFIFGDVAELIRKKQKNKIYPTIKGPQIGQIKYFLKFLTNQNILIQAKIQGDELYPIFTAFSKHEILNYLQNQIFNVYFLRLFIVLILAIDFNWMRKDLNKIRKSITNKLKNIFNRQLMNNLKIYESNADNMQQQKLCIVCYFNARNTLFFECKHLILCNQCHSNLQQAICPLCKRQINDQKYLYEQKY